jgi:hypothetical protein
MAFFDLLKGALLNLLWPLVFVLIGTFLRRKIAKRFPKLKWFASAFVSCFVLLSLTVLLAYFIPVYFGLSQSLLGLPPPSTGYTLIDLIIGFVFQFFRLLVVGLMLSFVAMPFVLLGSFVFEFIKSKFKTHYLVYLTASVYVVMLVFFFLLFYVFSELLQGVIYLIYFWMG